MNILHKVATTGTLMILAAGLSVAQSKQGSDQGFMKKAAEGGVAEVQMGQLAAQKASSSAVKQFGQRMVDDHTKANDQLKGVASQEGVTLPAAPDAKQQATINHLSSLSGAKFDRAYMETMVKDHHVDIAEFRHESNDGSNPQVKGFASKTLPILEDHLKDAEQTRAQLTK